jgi:transcriptional regulator with XRE-family HTH domain
MNLGKVIKKLRTDNKMTQEELSLRLGVTRPYIHMMEDGERNPSPDLIDGLAIIFDIPAAILMFMAIEETDIKESKRKYFAKTKADIDILITNLL